jgi:hypothetical protein
MLTSRMELNVPVLIPIAGLPVRSLLDTVLQFAWGAQGRQIFNVCNVLATRFGIVKGAVSAMKIGRGRAVSFMLARET